MRELWKSIKNYEGLYQASNLGKIKSCKRYGVKERILNGEIDEWGYRRICLSKNKKTRKYKAHRLILEAFLPNKDKTLQVNHKDGNKLNNNVNNLEWAEYSENTKHAYDNNLIKERRKSEYYKNDLENEFWKKIKDFPYSVSSYGRVRNDRTNLLLKPSLTCGYYKVRLSYDGIVKDITIHNLVYCTFNNLNNIPEGYVVDHIDSNKINNKLDNLQLITLSENVKNALYKTGTNNSVKAVIQMTLNDEYINEFPSCVEAAKQLGVDSSTISKVCRGIKYKSHGGFHFKYK